MKIDMILNGHTLTEECVIQNNYLSLIISGSFSNNVIDIPIEYNPFTGEKIKLRPTQLTATIKILTKGQKEIMSYDEKIDLNDIIYQGRELEDIKSELENDLAKEYLKEFAENELKINVYINHIDFNITGRILSSSKEFDIDNDAANSYASYPIEYNSDIEDILIQQIDNSDSLLSMFDVEVSFDEIWN